MAPTRSPDRREGSSGREEMLSVARRLFMTRGYRAVSTREIANAVGVTQPALYHHFGGKEDLYVAVLEDELAQLEQAIRRAAQLDAPSRDRLEAVAIRIAERADYDLSLMFHDLRFEVSPATRRRIGMAFASAMMTPMAVVLRALVDDGSIPPLAEIGLSERDVTMFILSVIRTLTERGGPGGAGAARAPETIGVMTVRLVLNGLGRDGT